MMAFLLDLQRMENASSADAGHRSLISTFSETLCVSTLSEANC